MINFSGRHFKKDLIMMAIRWYIAYTLSYRDIEERHRHVIFRIQNYMDITLF
ncbi:hypothetical protein PsalMR5_04631 (plasmid) [Piscirickettsia salmonis]|nr:hypothetical protein PsalSR1_04585 [Piscirickettsia salmonis]QGP61894.1 hypothetical protein PsalBI1_04536 [Piscirickettsia salmonis]QGP66706.1 hypothetical protein PsalMR5_04631 [Piscirickettsia salmonis]